MNNLGCILQVLNRNKEAKEIFTGAIDFRKAYLLPNHRDIGISMLNLASVL
jgi:hypothetical protein